MCPTGAGVGEGDTYQGVYVDDGSTAVDTLDHLVHQTIHSSLHFCFCYGHLAEGTLHNVHVYVLYIQYMHVHVYTCIYICMKTSSLVGNTLRGGTNTLYIYHVQHVHVL